MSQNQNYLAVIKVDPADVEALITPRTNWLVLNSPGNPTGAVYTLAELRSAAEALPWPAQKSACLRTSRSLLSRPSLIAVCSPPGPSPSTTTSTSRVVMPRPHAALISIAPVGPQLWPLQTRSSGPVAAATAGASPSPASSPSSASTRGRSTRVVPVPEEDRDRLSLRDDGSHPNQDGNEYTN